jgi:hypothetical protein
MAAVRTGPSGRLSCGMGLTGMFAMGHTLILKSLEVQLFNSNIVW